MLNLATRAQVTLWNLRNKAAAALVNENGEMNIFAVLLFVVIIIVVGGLIFLFLRNGATIVTDKGTTCLTDPANCS